MELFFIVTQVWTDKDGQDGIRGFIYKEEDGQAPAANRAIAKYHEILAHGSVSDDLYHASRVTRSDGATIKEFEYYDRRTDVVPENESEPETGNEQAE